MKKTWKNKVIKKNYGEERGQLMRKSSRTWMLNEIEIEMAMALTLTWRRRCCGAMGECESEREFRKINKKIHFSNSEIINKFYLTPSICVCLQIPRVSGASAAGARFLQSKNWSNVNFFHFFFRKTQKSKYICAKENLIPAYPLYLNTMNFLNFVSFFCFFSQPRDHGDFIFYNI